MTTAAATAGELALAGWRRQVTERANEQVVW